MNAEFEKASLLKETNVGYSNASRPIARVAGYYAGRCVIQPLDPAAVLPEGLALYVAAPPAHDAALVEALRNMLSDDDIRHLRRFQEICEDSDADGHDLPKEAVRRLERAGALRSCGFGRHETTLFGDAILAALAGKGGAQ